MQAKPAETARFGVGLVGLAALSAIVWLTIWAVVAPPMFGWSSVAVTSGSMEPLIDAGDIVVIAPYDGQELAAGSVVVFEGAGSQGRVTHRVVAETPDGRYVTRGDANGRNDSTPVRADEIVGVGRMLVPNVGRPVVWIETGQWSQLALVGAVLVAALWASRWALLARFNPWRPCSVVPPSSGRASKLALRVMPIVVIVAVAALVVTMVTTTRTSANYAVTTDSTSNSIVGDILQPPTALSVTGGAVASLGWTITPDAYALGHRIYRASSSGGPYAQVAQTTPRTTAAHVDAPPDGTYYYVVRAYTTNWESVNSNEDSAVVVVDDFDAVPTVSDNCPTTFNVDQFDTDGDGAGDACDPSPTVASSGVFTSNGQALGSADTGGLAFGDLDGDGDLDAMSSVGGANSVWVNTGSGAFADSGQALGSGDGEGLALADIDGDGDLDAMTANRGAANRVWINDGTAVFTDSGQALDPGDSWGVAFGDVDGDGDLDALVANNGQANTVWLNNGSGTFSNSGQALGGASTKHIVLGDVDGDGDLDAMVANSGANRVWLNNGTGTFTDSGQALGSSTSNAVTLGDTDGDGDTDAVFANSGANRVWLNNGTGTFTDSGQTLGAADSRGVALGDVDGDGDLDAHVANFGAPNTVWINDAGPAIGLADSWQSGLTHTAGAGTDRVLVFVATNEEQSIPSPTLSAVTYGGQALTPVMSDEVGNGCCSGRVEMWILDEAGIAAAASTTIVPTWSSTPDTPLYSHAVFDNVDQVTPTGASTSATVIGDTPNPVPMGPVVTSTGDVVVAAAMAGEHGTYTAQNGFTLGLTQATTTGGTTAHGTADKAATGASETVSMLFNPTNPPWTNRQVALALVLNVAP